MAKVTIAVAVLLIALGLIGFLATGAQHRTALIPAAAGVLLGVCGVLALDPERRKLWMHIAVTLGLLGALETLSSTWKMVRLAQHEPVPRPEAVYAQFAMFLICAVYVGLCVRSFIAARQSRTA